MPPRDELAARCREAGLKATPQRLAVWTALLKTTAHPGPDDVFRAVRAELPSVSLATVYKTLDSLEEAGLIDRVPARGPKRYDANQAPHHHLVCKRCGAIRDFHDPALDLEAPSVPGFVAQGVNVQITGVCDECAPHEITTSKDPALVV
jgi:Fur family peroxide stress response transcriptional regulator